MRISFYIIIAAISCLMACGPKKIYNKEIAIAERIWEKEKIISFEFDVIDTTKRYDFLLDVESKSEFKYQNMYVQLETVFPKGNKAEDIVSLEISQPNGKPNGDCSGEECHTPIMMQENVKFPDLGQYTINIKQYSRMDKVEGISKLELTIQESPLSK
jgi:gliding motility-associated lipoprotein GldH